MNDSLKQLPGYLISTDSNLGTDALFFIVQKLAVAILIGALLGLEREHSRGENEKTFAGIRTFPLISIFGFVAALVSTITSFWIYAAMFGAFASLVVVNYNSSTKAGQPGGTSEVALLTVFVLGSLVFWDLIIFAAITSVILMLFLSLKLQFHEFIGKINEQDIYATLKFAIITVIILPLLPDRTFGPLNILNPRMIWLVVVLVTGISFVGYILIKFYSRDKGIPLAGFLGGLVSSTALTVSFARKSKSSGVLSKILAVGIFLASTIMFVRIFILAVILSPQLFNVLWFPMVIFTITGFAVSYLFFTRNKEKREANTFDLKNPFELKSALIFGSVFAVILFSSKAAETYLGDTGVYAASAIAGLTSVDAIIVSISELAGEGFSKQSAVIAILIAAVSNNFFKIILTLWMGDKRLFAEVVKGLGIITLPVILYIFYLFIK